MICKLSWNTSIDTDEEVGLASNLFNNARTYVLSYWQYDASSLGLKPRHDVESKSEALAF